MTKSALSKRLDKRARTAARSACLFYDASTGMMRFLPDTEKQRYFVPFGVSFYLLQFLSLELSLKALRILIRKEDYQEKHLLNQLFGELRSDGQEMIEACCSVERQEIISFLRKHQNAIMDLRYYGKDFSLTQRETTVLRNLNDACIWLLEKFDMRFSGRIDRSERAKEVMKRLST